MERKPLIDIFMHINSQVNLSAIRDEQGIYTKHILDSLEGNKVFEFKPGQRICDVGTGGGFPLLPLAMTNPQSEFVGMDGTKKKIEAIRKMVDELKITNVKLVRSRAEESKETYDVVCARAVAYVDKLLERTFHLVKPGGYFILFKQYLPEEKEKLKYVCKNNDIVVLKEHKYSLFPEDIQRVIYVLQKK